jgi:ABC-type transport system involved in multi-copper enzyme maturation permease subunit
MSASTRLDRVNPVLVKEVRQAVRGKSFRGSFILALTIAAVVSTAVLSSLNVENPQELARSGTNLFYALHAVFLFWALIAVPVQANRSMASERDERTFDALIISGLSPAQIVLGKWLSAGVSQLIFLLALLPFFATAATLYGLDLLMAVVLTLFACFLGLTLSLLGILAATLSQSKAIVSVLMMMFLATCGFAMLMMIALGQSAMYGFGGFGSSDEFFVVMGLLSAASFFILFWLHGLAVATISHPEENGMLRVRWATLSCLSAWLRSSC